MAGSQLNTYSVGDVNLTNIMEVLDVTRQGFHKVSLTNMTNNGVPAIASGSRIEINGAIFLFDDDETITGTPSSGDTYIKLTVSGSSVTAAFTNTAPTWDDEKQGWYEAATNNRYVNFRMNYSGGSYYNKIEFLNSSLPGGNFGDVDCSYVADATGNGDIIVTATVVQSAGTVNQEFYLLKPVSAYFYIYSNSTYYTNNYINLNPGHYRIRITSFNLSNNHAYIEQKKRNDWATLVTDSGMGGIGGVTAWIYMMGCYGITNANDLNKVRTLL